MFEQDRGIITKRQPVQSSKPNSEECIPWAITESKIGGWCNAITPAGKDSAQYLKSANYERINYVKWVLI